MATVYLAEDLKHKRKVALKVLKPELAAVVGGERFLAEIETTANLTHPNILPLFDSGEADSFLYYVMPFVEGESLRDRLDREKQLGVDDAVRLAREVAEALHHAHEHGVVHRDVKPANILLQDGRPLVSDFGIALAVSQAGGGRLTETGLSMGTPHYMSPEQASGDRDVDPRTDVYSLGCVLFEMLTGEPPYGGGTAQAVLARILTGEPDRPTEIRGTIPRHVEAVVLKAMEKLPADRFESTGELALALKDESFRHGEDVGAEAGARAGGLWKPAAIAAGVVAVIALGLVAWLTTRPPDPQPTLRTVYGTLEGQEIQDQLHHVASFAPDGSLLVYEGPGPNGTRLWLKERDQVRARPLEGTDGAQHPEVDPTGRWVAFTVGQELRKLPLGGGSSVVLGDSATADIGSIAWLDDGTIVYSIRGFRPRRVPAVGGTATDVPVPFDIASQGTLGYTPLPGGDFLYILCQNFCRELAELWAWDSSEGSGERLVPGVVGAWYVDPGHVVFLRPNGSVFSVGLEPGSLELKGEPVPLFEGVQIDNAVIPDMEVSPSGHVLLRMGRAGSEQQRLVWVDRDGSRTVADPEFIYRHEAFTGVRISPDDRRVAFSRTTDSGADIWVKELDAGPAYRLTFDDAMEYRPDWSPDGEFLMFVSERGENRDLYRRRSNATGPVELVLDRSSEISQGIYSADGEWLVYREGTGEGRDLWALRLTEGGEPIPLVAAEGYDEKAPALSPDGRWLLYESDETGSEEVYARPFPNVEDGKWQISVGGGREPVWSHDGGEVFYIRGDDMLVAASVDPGPPFSVGTRSELFSTTGLRGRSTDHASYDVSRDDQRFLFTVGERTGPAQESYWLLIENWGSELAELREGAR